MSWSSSQGNFDPEKHARRKEERARERERLAEQQRQEQARLAAQEAERAVRVEQSLSRDVHKQPAQPSQKPEQQVATGRSVRTPQTGPDSYRLTRGKVGCWGFVGLYILFFILFAMGSGALSLVDQGLGSIAMIGVPLLAYIIWQRFYRQYRGGFGFVAVGGGLLVIGFLLMLVITPFVG